MLYLKRKPLKTLIQIRRAMLWIALLGLFASTYLFVTYVFGGPIVCGISSGCETVRASEWAHTFGGIPRPVLGIVFYGFIILGLAWRTYAPHKHPRFWTNLTWIAGLVGFLESIFLTYVQGFVIHAFCLWCVTSAVCATLIFALSFFDTDETMDNAKSLKELKVLLLSFVVALVVGAVGLHLLLVPPADGDALKLSSASPQELDAKLLPPGTTIEGPATSTVTIVEFLDYECPSCGGFNPVMKKIRQEYAGRIRYAVRIFPLVEIHPHAKGAAIGAVCAERQGKFLDYGDALMANQQRLERSDLLYYADALHLNHDEFNTCLDDPKAADTVVADRKAADALGLDHTPTIFINGETLDGTPTYAQLKILIDQRLK